MSISNTEYENSLDFCHILELEGEELVELLDFEGTELVGWLWFDR